MFFMRPSQFKFTKIISRFLKLSSQILLSNMHQKIKIPRYPFQATTFHQSNVSITVLLRPERQAEEAREPSIKMMLFLTIAAKCLLILN
jgi:hypothetical protein